MNKKQNIAYLKHKSLKKNPFSVPDGYFEDFSERLQDRIREEEASKVHLRRIGTTRFRAAIAAAVVGLALISYSIIRFTLPNSGTPGIYPDIALLEQMYVIDDDNYLLGLMDSETEELDEEEAFANQAIDYLSINDVEMVLIFE